MAIVKSRVRLSTRKEAGIYTIRGSHDADRQVQISFRMCDVHVFGETDP
jgi:hypothetical protein